MKNNKPKPEQYPRSFRSTIPEIQEALNGLNNYYKIKGLNRDWKACTDCPYIHCMWDCQGYHNRNAGRERNIEKERGTNEKFN